MAGDVFGAGGSASQQMLEIELDGPGLRVGVEKPLFVGFGLGDPSHKLPHRQAALAQQRFRTG
jgi:hypothetical protein